jgi:hypothetical protein
MSPKILTPFSRRNLLIATGLSGASMFLPSMLGRGVSVGRASAQSAPIKRLVIVTQSHGVVREAWRMLRNQTDYGNWEYDLDDPNPESFSEILAPLHSHRDKLLILEGLAQTSALGDRAINNHNAAQLHLLTGARMQSDSSAGGASVDQVIARAIGRPDRIASLEYASGGLYIGGFVNSGPGQRVPVEMNPRAAFSRLFPSGSAAETEEPSERERIRSARGSVLDFVRGEYQSIAPRLSSEDRKKLDMHRDIVRDLEQRSAALSKLVCEAPTDLSTAPGNIEHAKAFADLTAAAFACDLTRVATIQLAQLANDEFGAPPGDVHQDYAHQAGSDPNATRQMTNYSRKNTEVFGYLLDALSRYQDGEGTLLDNTVAVFMSELATGPHDLDKIPVVLAGSAGGHFRTGRYLSYAQDTPNPHEHPSWGAAAGRPIGPGHSHLLVSLMQAMGLEDDSIGESSVVTRDGDNTEIDLTGALERLT